MNNSKIGTKEAIFIILTISIAHTILSMPRNILSTTKSAAIINLIYICIILISICLLVVKLFKNFPGLDILDISEYLGGKTFKKITGLLFIVYFIVSSSLLLREFSEAIKIVYYPMTNIFFVIVFFIIAIAITNKLNFNSTLSTNLIIIPLVLFSGIFLFVSNIKNFNYDTIFPLLGTGLKDIFITGIGNIYCFSSITTLYFLPPLLKKIQDFKKISIISIVIFIIYLILTVCTISFMFSAYMSEDEILPLYAAARYIQIGSFFVRLESIFLLIWIILFACYLSIACKLSMLVLKKITNIKETTALAYPIAFLMLGISLIPKTYASVKQYESNIYPYASLIFNYVYCILLLLFANLKKKREKNI